MAGTRILERKEARGSGHAHDKSQGEEVRYSVGRRAGGRFSNLRPVFSKDDKYLFLCTRNQARVYSATNGDLIRTLLDRSVPKTPIVSMFLHPTNEYRLVTVSQDAQIIVWDWSDGTRLQKTKVQAASEIVTALLVDTTLIWSDGKQVSMSTEFPNLEKTVLIGRLSVCYSITVSENRLFAHGDRSVLLFRLKESNKTTTEHEYITLPTSQTAFAASKDTFAYADGTGAMYVYEIQAFGKNKDLVPRKLHWHASSVFALQFALNGDYVLSGGEEGVLVLWQLSTSSKQFLPRIAGKIDAIAVSPSSKHYGLKLNDNSVKVIAATNLELRTSISGPRYTEGLMTTAVVDNDIIMGNGAEAQIWNVPTGRTALRVPVSHQTHAGKVRNEFSSNEAAIIGCATVDSWLATVDSWVTPKEESIDLGYTKPLDETNLKFWQWTGKDYTLITRIDAPHGDARVTQLISTGSGTFVTAGDDGAVKFWRQKPVKKDLIGGGTQVVGTTWVCRQVLRITRQGGPCKMALSEDGTVLALHTQSLEQTFLIDPTSGELKATISGLSTGRLVGLGFTHKHLIILGYKRLVVWNLLTGTVTYALKLPESTTELYLSCSSKTFLVSTNEQTRQLKTNAKIFIFSPESPKPIFREKCDRTIALNWSRNHGFIQITSDLDIVFISEKDNAMCIDKQSLPITTSMVTATGGISETYRPIKNRNTATLEDLPDGMQDLTLSTQKVARIFDDPLKNLVERFDDLAMLVLGEPKNVLQR